MAEELKIVSNDGLEVAEDVAEAAVEKTTQWGPIAVGVGAGVLGGALLFLGISKLIKMRKAKKIEAQEEVAIPDPKATPATES